MRANLTARTITALLIGLISFGKFSGVLPLVRARETAAAVFDLDDWLVVDEASQWSEAEKTLLEEVVANTLEAVSAAGGDADQIFKGFRFRRFQGEYAENKEGKIAFVRFPAKEIILSNTIFRPEYEFFLYHEMGHIIDRHSGGKLNDLFHSMTLQIEGATTLHEWTTAQTFYLRGQAHIRKPEATADAFALWVWVKYARREIPHFHDTPENADPEAILEIFGRALTQVYEAGPIDLHQTGDLDNAPSAMFTRNYTEKQNDKESNKDLSGVFSKRAMPAFGLPTPGFCLSSGKGTSRQR